MKYNIYYNTIIQNNTLKYIHVALDNLTPDEVYYNLPHPFAEAA